MLKAPNSLQTPEQLKNQLDRLIDAKRVNHIWMGRDNEFKRAPRNISEYNTVVGKQQHLELAFKPLERVGDSHITIGFEKPQFSAKVDLSPAASD